MEIKEALAKLDHDDNDQWTADGLPRIDVVANLTGDKQLKRQDITDADPKFMRGVQADAEVEGKEEAQQEDEAQEEVALTRDELLEAEPADLSKDAELCDLYLREANAYFMEMDKEVKKLQIRMKNLSTRVNVASRFQEQHQRQKNRGDGSILKQFQKRQLEARQAKVENARKFLAANTSADDVAKQLNPRSPLDTAMRARKPAIGSTRPDPRLPVRK